MCSNKSFNSFEQKCSYCLKQNESRKSNESVRKVPLLQPLKNVSTNFHTSINP